jgi:bifunctional non-homologous end joining protein LigD
VRAKPQFIKPCLPTLRKEPPTGERWRHEVKFDGWRVQLHLEGDNAIIFSRNGNDFTARFPEIHLALILMPARAAIIDAELTACDANGMPDFSGLLSGDPDYLCVWCFDLLSINGKDVRSLPYFERKGRLESLVNRSGDDHIRYSEHFDQPQVLLKACSRMKLEGIVSKRTDASYHSGPSKDWIKVKCQKWREENEWRDEFFQKRK